MVIGRNEVNNNLVIGLGNKLVRAFTEIWNETEHQYIQKGYWTTIYHHDPVMIIEDIDKPFNKVERDMLNIQNQFKDLKWEDGFKEINFNIVSK